MKRQATEREEIVANIYPTQNFYLECVKNSYNSILRRQFNLKIGRRFEWILPQRRHVDGTERSAQHSVTRKMQSIPVTRHPSTTTRAAKIKYAGRPRAGKHAEHLELLSTAGSTAK